jgi:diguanylate cyclase (GGDEF)-like protein
MNQTMEELIRRNQLLEAEVERLRVYKEFAYTDVLTEIPNRRFFYERLTQEVARARRNEHDLTVALLDLDRFKELNDRAGHRTGDQVLKFFAQFLRANLRQEDVICRLGGDEFTLLLPDTNVVKAKVLLERIRQKLDRIELSIDGRTTCELSFSCGLSSYESGLLAEDLIEEADHSLFSAKARGRNRVVGGCMQTGVPVAALVH